MAQDRILDGYYTAKPTCWGFTKTKKGYDQFAIEFSIRVTDESGIEGDRVLTWFQGFDQDIGLKILRDGLDACGWNGDFENIELNKDADVRVKVETDSHGQKIKSVYSASSQGLVTKYGISEGEAKSIAATLNARMRAIPVKQTAAQRQVAPQRLPQTQQPAQPRSMPPQKQNAADPWDEAGADAEAKVPF